MQRKGQARWEPDPEQIVTRRPGLSGISITNTALPRPRPVLSTLEMFTHFLLTAQAGGAVSLSSTDEETEAERC